MNVRTRVAPSPTGDPHVGTAYMALFNRVFAHSQGGSFVLRIEDTDVTRSSDASEAMILDALRWLGLDWDEGPDRPGPYGPYRQSERTDRYRTVAEQLVDSGHAFACFCTPERLDELRAGQRARGETQRYDGHCRGLDAATVNQRLAAGEAHVIRMVIPEAGVCRFEDVLRGPIEIDYAQVDMQVLIKSDGYPTYHLAVVVDDHDMAISHVLRGEEWINSTPKHVLLYDYLGWEAPAWGHLPLLRNPDQSKLSKRRHPTSINYYRATGYLPEALVNYLGMMGWSMPDERELFSPEDMEASFDLSRISLGGPIFDQQKLGWLNGQYLRALPDEAFAERVRAWAFDRSRLEALIPLVKERTERLADLAPQVDYLLGDRRVLSAQDFAHRKLGTEECRQIIYNALRLLDPLREWNRDNLYDLLKRLADAMGLSLREVLFPLFVAVSGRAVALPLFDSMAFLGPDVTRVRMREAIETLGGVGKKLEKRYDRSFRALDLGP